MKKPLILITNDDGITAPGIRNLVSFMNEIGEVVVVAPDSPQSGKGHAVTINSVLTSEKIKPDLVVSGINHGSNSSINILYSGTMSAAVEAGVEGIQAIGFSLLDFSWDADFSQAKEYIQSIVRNVLENPLPKGIVLNVNIPNLKKNEIKGVKVCKQANAKWEENFDERVNPHGKKYYWLTGYFNNMDESENADEVALDKGYITIVPVKFDLTAYEYIDQLSQQFKK